MEDDQSGRQPKWKITKMEDDQMEDDQNGRRNIKKKKKSLSLKQLTLV